MSGQRIPDQQPGLKSDQQITRKTTGQLVVIDPAMHTPEVDCFNAISRLSPWAASYHLPALCGLASLHEVEKQCAANKTRITGIIVLGSASSVNDRHPWQLELSDWLKPRIDERIPFLGFCFGHQLLAHIHGATVDFVRADHEKLKGFDSVEITQSRLFPAGTRKILRSHREMVTSVPDGFRILARNPSVAIDGLEHEVLPVWSLQTHPEATAGFLRNQEMDQEASTVDAIPEADPLLGPGWQIVRTFLEQLT